MDEIIKKLILLFTLLLTLTVNAQVEQQEEVNDEYKENNFQGEEENYPKIILKESDLVRELWGWMDRSGTWEYYPNRKLLMCNNGKITEEKWDIELNNVRIYNSSNELIYKFTVVYKGFDKVTVLFNDSEIELYRIQGYNIREYCK